MEGHSVSKMICSPPGYVGFEEGGQLSEKVRRNPYSVVLFDEIEKAHPDVFNVLLQVLDDGHITDSKGRKVSFKNTVLIMTSNAGAQRIVDPKNLGFATEKSETKDYEKMKSNVMEEVKRSFKPEFINRIDDIIVFHQLNNENMKEIVNLLASNLYNKCFVCTFDGLKKDFYLFRCFFCGCLYFKGKKSTKSHWESFNLSFCSIFSIYCNYENRILIFSGRI